MTQLEENVNHYMKLKEIKTYIDLLKMIARELGVKVQDSYDFAKRERNNFSKMLKGKRPLKYEFIVPLEKIFGVSLARMLEKDAYKLPVNKDNVPFNKGFRYYAYLDDPKLYEKEFDKILAKDGNSILTHTDEFGKSFLDYVVEYNSVNGVRYLHKVYGIKLKYFHNQFEFQKVKGFIYIDFNKSIEFARLVASMNDVKLFNNIFDSYYMFFTSGHYGGNTSMFCNSEYLEILLDNDSIFNSLFEFINYELDIYNVREKSHTSFYTFNPIINNCLNYAIKHLDKYRDKVLDMLHFGLDNITRIGKKTNIYDCYTVGELGRIQNSKDRDFFDIIIYVEDKNIEDKEIKKLVEQLSLIKFQ